MNSKKTLVAFASIAFALVVAGPVSAACSLSTLNECDSAGLQALIAQLLGGTQTGTTQTGVTTPSACQGVTFSRNLSLGSTGADVKCLQAVLNNAADTQVAATGVGSAGYESTYFGVKTQTAVKAFQTKYGISPVAGFVGSITRAKLNELLAAGTGTGTGTGTGLPAGCTTASGYSPTTGQSCSVATNLPAGCTTAAGYSPTTGLSCAGTGTGTGTGTVAGTPLTAALAADTPVGGNILVGEANKTVAKVTFTAAADADATINTLRIKSYGTAASGDIKNVKIYDNGSQIGSTYATMSAGTALFTFVPGITITKGTSKTLDIVASVPVSTNYSATVRLGLESASSIGGTVFTGTFPIVGNSYTVIYGGNIGTVTASKISTIPSTSVGAGTPDVVLGNFRVSADSTESISIKQLVVSYDSTVTSSVFDSDVTNIRAVTADGVVQGTASGFSSRKATINFAAPITVAKGGSATFKILGDVVLGVGRNIRTYIESGAVSATGLTSGVGIANTAATDKNSLISITAGRLTVSVSTASPSGSSAQYVKSSSLQTLGVFNLKSTGEDVLLSKMYLTVSSANASGTIKSVGIYNESGSRLVSTQTYDLAAANWDTTPAVNEFDVGETIYANTTQQYYVKAITSDITSTGSAVIAVVLDNTNSTGKSIIGTGLTSSGQEGQSSDNVYTTASLTLPSVTVYSGASATLAANTAVTPQDQAVLTGAAQVLVGTIKVNAQRENQNLNQLVLTGVPSTSTVAALFSGVALYEGTTQLTDFVAPVGDTVTFSDNDILDTVTFVKNTAKTLKIVANTLGTGNGRTIYFTIGTNGMTTIGVDSSEISYAPVATTTLTFSDGVNTHGTYTLSNAVVSITKDAASPSGTPGRGTLKPYAIWDLQSYGTTSDITLNTLTLTSNSGLPAGLTATTTDLAMFRLIDADDSTVLASSASTLNAADGTVTFTISANNVITSGEVKRIELLITTNDSTAGKWVANTGMLWTVGAVADATFSAGNIAGSGDGSIFSIPADTNAVSIGN